MKNLSPKPLTVLLTCLLFFCVICISNVDLFSDSYVLNNDREFEKGRG